MKVLSSLLTLMGIFLWIYGILGPLFREFGIESRRFPTELDWYGGAALVIAGVVFFVPGYLIARRIKRKEEALARQSSEAFSSE